MLLSSIINLTYTVKGSISAASTSSQRPLKRNYEDMVQQMVDSAN